MSSFSPKAFLCFGVFSEILRTFYQRYSIMKKRCHIPDGVRAAICKMFQNGDKVSGITRNLSM